MKAGPIDVAPLEPIVSVEVRRERVPPAEWVRRNLFSTPLNSLLTLVMAIGLGGVFVQLIRFLFLASDWEIVRVNLTTFMVGLDFPRDQVWRVWVAIVFASAFSGVSAGLEERRRREATALM
ncbi:MAG: hypothetical protein ACRDJC_25250, partial [Thermomicrobiales bacterium]